MTFSLHTMSTGTFVPMLRDLSGVLDKGAQHAKDKKLDPATLVNAKLAPDMFTLAMQVKIACNHAQGTTARLTGKEPPPSDDMDTTFDALKARIAKTIAAVEAVPESAFASAEDRDIEMPLINELMLHVKGFQLLKDWALPHFYFHVVTAYDILRHAGVEIGKRDYLAHIGPFVRQGGKPLG
jgi:hypothetical protein